MRIFVLMCLVGVLNAQPGDPGGDPDDTTRHYSHPSDPSGDPDLFAHTKKELVCDSIKAVDQNGKRFVVLYYQRKIVAVYRKEKRYKPIKSNGVSGYSFY